MREDFTQHEPRIGHVKHGVLGDDDLHAGPARERQRAARQDLGIAVFVGVRQRGNHLARAVAEVHRPANAGPPFAVAIAGPVGEVAQRIHLQRAEDRHVDVAVAHRAQRRGEVHERRAGHQGDGLAAGVGEVAVDGVQRGASAKAEGAVFGMEDDARFGVQVVGCERWDTQAKVDDFARVQFLRAAGCDALLGCFGQSLHGGFLLWRSAIRLLRQRAGGQASSSGAGRARAGRPKTDLAPLH